MLNRWAHDPSDRAFEEDVALWRASQGTEEYHRYWNSVSRYWRDHLWRSGLHEHYKKIAAAADKLNETKSKTETKEK